MIIVYFYNVIATLIKVVHDIVEINYNIMSFTVAQMTCLCMSLASPSTNV